MKNVPLNCECVPAEGEGAGGRLKASEVMSCECLLNWWGILETGSTSWGGWYKNSETHNYCKCTLLTAASVVTVSADLRTVFSSLHLLNLDLSLKNKQQGGYIRCWGREEPPNTHSYNHKQPYWLSLWLVTHTGVWIQIFPAHMTDFSPWNAFIYTFTKARWKRMAPLSCLMRQCRWAGQMWFGGVGGGGQDSVSGGSEEMGLLQQSPRTFHLPQDIMTTPRCLKNTHIYATV